MSKPKQSEALLYLVLTILGLYVFSSIISLSFSMSGWHTLSSILFWGGSIVLTVWTFNDYFINPKDSNKP